MKNELYSASSCAVENCQDGIRLTLQFMHFAEYNAAFDNFAQKPDLFALDLRKPRDGGCSGGSKIVVVVRPEFALAAGEDMGSFTIRRTIDYVNGARTPCESILSAMRMARDHA